MKFLKQFSLYTFVGFFNAGISFLLMPYLSHFIDPFGYGVLSLVNSFVTILIPLVGLTASGLIAVEYYRVKDKKEFASIFSSIQAIPIIPGIVFLIFTLFFPDAIARLFEVPINKSYWIPLSVLIALFSIYYESLAAYIVIEQKATLYVKFSLVRLFIEVGLTLLFVSVFKWSWEGRLLSWLISTVISFVISILYFKRQGLLTFDIKKKHFIAGIVFGLPLILHTIGKFVINQSDRIFIAKMVSLEEAGIYNIGYQVGMAILIVVTATTNFIQPFLYERLAHLNQKSKIEIVRVSYSIIAGLFILLFVLVLITPFLFHFLIDERYLGGSIYVFWTGLGYLLWGVYIIFAGYIFYAKKTRILGYLSILNVVLNILLNYLLIKKYGAIGASYATCISYLIIVFIIIFNSTRLYLLPWLNFKLIFSK